MVGDSFDADRLILEAATSARNPTEDELRRVLEHVARAGFDPSARERARGALAGIEWQGRILKGTDTLPPAERHYLVHVVQRLEWPSGTTLSRYLRSIRNVVLDPASGVLTNRYQGARQLGIVRESGDLRGPQGYDWILVQYRLGLGHWVTTFQPQDGLDKLNNPGWSDVRWLRQPAYRSGLNST